MLARLQVCIVHVNKRTLSWLFHPHNSISFPGYYQMVQIHAATGTQIIRNNRVKVVSFQQKIVERFHRNKSKEANEDVAERVFLVSDERINLTFHLEDNRVTASTREFIRPPHTTEKGGTLTMTPDMTTTFQVSFNTCTFKN